MKKYVLIGLAILMVGCASPGHLATTSKQFTPPKGYFTYEGRVPDYEALTNTDYTVKELEDLHFELSRKFKYVTEEKEKWTSEMIGDCDDFAIRAHLELADRGINSRLALVMFKTRDKKVVGHLVTVVDDYVFDVSNTYLNKVDRVPYRFVASGNLASKTWDKTYIKYED